MLFKEYVNVFRFGCVLFVNVMVFGFKLLWNIFIYIWFEGLVGLNRVYGWDIIIFGGFMF